ncbi:GNAT family N-acetyltransferase [Haloprofundus halophilus]|uniref:GNAT family N-acetyltransferase n=1 Tax=Haloprofundus halophilus TaxID=2283527 RepID=UPI000E43B3CE|nr:GNAT family N-acetyltransferase [Haloprofundus halophilus]
MDDEDDERESYRVRQYEPTDREAVLSLYETVFDRTDPNWFDWRYVENPYLDETPVAVAETESDGEIVGARPSVPIPLRAGDERVLAVVQVDPMVDPDHRRRGLFSKMVTHVYDHYATREPQVSIGFPNEAVLGALDKLGERLSLHRGVTREFPVYYRVQNPTALASLGGERAGKTLGKLATAATRGYLSLRTGTPADADVSVRRETGVPAEELAGLVAASPLSHVHADRDAEFYAWRYANPRFEYETLLAERRGSPVAAFVVGTQLGLDSAVVHVTDVAPLTGGEAWVDAVDALLARVVADNEDADLLSVFGEALPERLLGKYGFARNDEGPLSRVTSPNYLVARPLTDESVDEWTVGGRRLSDGERWRFTFCEREIG